MAFVILFKILSAHCVVFIVFWNCLGFLLLRDREKGKFEMFYSTQNRNLNFPAAAAETFKSGDSRKVKPAPHAETFKGGHPREATPTSLPKET